MNDIGFNGDVLVDGDMTSVIGCAAVRLTNLSLYLSIYIYITKPLDGNGDNWEYGAHLFSH